MSLDRVVIIGAGPAGMGCAYTLAKAKQDCLVIEKDTAPGGLCRTIDFRGYLFDIGGHRFISKSEEINNLWHRVMDGDMLRVRRLSRIYYRKKYFKYPLSFFNTFWNLGPAESLLCVGSYLKHRFLKADNSDTFEGWITYRFGKRLYNIFFKPYTEKIWSIPCQEISAHWAQQRIGGLSLKTAIKDAFLIRKDIPKTLSKEFFYPKTGPGEFYHRLEKLTESEGGRFTFGKSVTGISHNGRKILSIDILNSYESKKENLSVDYLFSSIPLPIFIRMLEPPPPKDIINAANRLRFRSLLVVNIIVDKEDLYPDQWIYIHSPEVSLGRIQNYKNWSPMMVADIKKTSLGLEYFCNEGNSLWNMNDADLIRHALGELEEIGAVSRRYFIDGFVVRRPNVYPVYLLGYQKNVDIIRNYLARFCNLQTIGRGGLFRYDNSDDALLSGIYAARQL